MYSDPAVPHAVSYGIPASYPQQYFQQQAFYPYAQLGKPAQPHVYTSSIPNYGRTGGGHTYTLQRRAHSADQKAHSTHWHEHRREHGVHMFEPGSGHERVHAEGEKRWNGDTYIHVGDHIRPRPAVHRTHPDEERGRTPYRHNICPTVSEVPHVVPLPVVSSSSHHSDHSSRPHRHQTDAHSHLPPPSHIEHRASPAQSHRRAHSIDDHNQGNRHPAAHNRHHSESHGSPRTLHVPTSAPAPVHSLPDDDHPRARLPSEPRHRTLHPPPSAMKETRGRTWHWGRFRGSKRSRSLGVHFT